MRAKAPRSSVAQGGARALPPPRTQESRATSTCGAAPPLSARVRRAGAGQRAGRAGASRPWKESTVETST